MYNFFMSESNPSESMNPDPKDSKKFSLEKALEGNYTLLEYSYKNEKDPNSKEKQFSVKLKSIKKYDPASRFPKIKSKKVPKKDEKYRIITNIFDSEGNVVGRLTGDVVKEADEYYALYMENMSNQSGEVEYPGLV